MNPSFSSATSPVPDSLYAGSTLPRATEPITLVAGAGALTRGAVLGKITIGDITPSLENGDFNGDLGEWTPGARTQVGVYRLICISESSDAGTFAVYAPDGSRLADLTVGVAYASDHLNGTIADGSEDADAGDLIEITVAPGSEKYSLSEAAAVDGSQVPAGILLDGRDASGEEDVEALAYTTGEFNKAALTFGEGHDADSVAPALRALGIILRDVVAA